MEWSSEQGDYQARIHASQTRTTGGRSGRRVAIRFIAEFRLLAIGSVHPMRRIHLEATGPWHEMEMV